jgi:hypothetical protein
LSNFDIAADVLKAYLSEVEEKGTWCFDSGANIHLSGNPTQFLDLAPLSIPAEVTTAGGHTLAVQARERQYSAQ